MRTLLRDGADASAATQWSESHRVAGALTGRLYLRRARLFFVECEATLVQDGDSFVLTLVEEKTRRAHTAVVLGPARQLSELQDARFAFSFSTEGETYRLRCDTRNEFEQWLSSVPSPHTALVEAVLHDHLECAQALIDAGAKLDVACGPGLETALHASCARGNAQILSALIDAGANGRGGRARPLPAVRR